MDQAFNPHLLVSPRKYTIGLTSSMAKSDRTFDIKVNDMAANKQLLDALRLRSFQATAADATRLFSFYLSSFCREGTDAARRFLEDNPTVRVLVEDEQVNTEVRRALGT